MNNEFRITEQKENGLLQIRISNNFTGEYITVLPGYGARLNDAILIKNDKQFRVLKNLTSPVIETRDQLFNNAKLFPFAGRIQNGKYSFNGKDYNLPLNYPEENNACHGLVYDKPFIFSNSKISEMDAAVTFEFSPSEINEGYPFKYKITLTYILYKNSSITCVTKIENTGSEEMLFSDGWHHYFCINSRSINELGLKADVNINHELNNFGLPTGKTDIINFTGSRLLGENKFDSVFSVNRKEKASVSLYSAADDISLNIWQQADEEHYNYLVIYTPPGRKTIAVEPITSMVNSFNNKKGIILLKPGKTWEGRMGFFIQ
jgi:aldose 1-epimerase